MTPSAAPESTARPRAAARPARVFAQGRFETLTLLRNGEQLLVSVVLPAMALVGLTLSPYPALGDVHRIDVTAPGVLALAVASTAFTGQAISTAFDRRYGVLRMYGVSPLGRSGLLMGKLIAVGAVLLVQVLLLGGLALALGWRPHLVGIPAALVAGGQQRIDDESLKLRLLLLGFGGVAHGVRGIEHLPLFGADHGRVAEL